jgi:uncharacterized protein (TIGR03643 family)
VPKPPAHTEVFIKKVIACAWADDISFDKIKRDMGISESDVIHIMRTHLKPRSFALWRKRVTGRSTKHEKRAKLLREEA